jgi:predicted transglutaminase-like cysteine proteinase
MEVKMVNLRFLTAAILFCLAAPMSLAQTAEKWAAPPYAWLAMCSKEPLANCRLAREVTPEDAAFVNITVNEGMTFKDGGGEGLDVWRVFPEDRVGDCDDAVASKRAALIAYGLSPEKLRIVAAKVQRKSGGYADHVVLEADIGGRSYILDNLYPHLYAADKPPPYKWERTAVQESSQVAWRNAAP